MGWLPWPLAANASSADIEASKASPQPSSPAPDALVVYRAVATPDTVESLEAGNVPQAAQATVSKSVTWCSYVETYGRFAGPGLFVGVVAALAWTVVLIAFNVAPTGTTNALFDSREIDDGDFWLLSSPGTTAPTATAIVVASLVMIAVYYLYLLFLLIWRRKDAAVVDDYVEPLVPSCSTCLCDFIQLHFSALDAESRPYLKVSEELPEIAYQTMLLAVHMESGVAPGLVVFVAIVIALNCFTRCYRVLTRATYHERYDSLANSIFQFFFAVLFPVVELVLALAAFAIDRQSYALRVEYFERGAFERLARFVQPESFTSTHATAKTLLQLLILSGDTKLAVATLGIHLALLWRWHDIVLGCLLGYKTQRVPMMGGRITHGNSLLNLLRVVKAVYWLMIKLLLACVCVTKRLIPRVFALLLFCFGVSVVVVTSIGLVHSRHACEPFIGRCVLQAVTFQGFSKDEYSACPCKMYVNQPKATSMSWSQWSIREDITDELSQVAASGRLHVVQIVDRDLPTLPDSLGNCRDLRELVFVRAALKTLPSWLVELDQLQLLHLAGDVNTTLSAFPDETEVLAKKHKLRSIRLENLRSLSRLPAFPERTLDSLRSITLIDLPLVRSLPLMEHITTLRELVLSEMASLQRLPLLPDRLEALRVDMPTALCCNGYLGETAWGCLSENATATSSSALEAQCHAYYTASANSTFACLTSDTLNTTQTTATQQWLQESRFACQHDIHNLTSPDNSTVTNAITQRAVAACDGQLHRECSLTWPLLPANVSRGMCLGAARLQIVHCAPKDPRYEALRRAEIRRRAACDPQIEQWLGCPMS